MKKFLLIVAALLLASTSFGQVEWGVKAGLNLANMSGFNHKFSEMDFSSSIKGKMVPNFHVGAFAEFRFSDLISLQPELMYSQQGTNVEMKFSGGDGFSGKMDLKFRYNYITLPVLVRLRLLDKLTLDLGPQFSYATKATLDVDGNDLMDWDEDFGFSGKTDLDSKSYNAFDVSAVMGLTYRITSFLDISARYNLGLTKVSTKDLDEGWDEDFGFRPESKNNVLQVSVAYRF